MVMEPGAFFLKAVAACRPILISENNNQLRPSLTNEITMSYSLKASIGTASAALALCLMPAAADGADTAKELLKMTGGKRVKVVWAQREKIQYFDTKESKLKELPFPGASQPLLTTDGLKVLCSVGPAADRSVMMYDTETKKLTTLTTGKYSGLLTVWRDPGTKRDWVYVNDAGSDGRNWDQPWGEMHRFPIDKPAEKEMCWNRTTTHFYFMLSADGTRACFEPNWSNIGQLNIAYDSAGKIDQEKSVYKTVGGGCFPGLAPDNSYRMFRLDGGHKAIEMTDADGANPRKIDMIGMPGVGDKGKQVWLTRWSTHPRYLSLMGPDGEDARIWVGRFDEGCTRIEEWVQVVGDGPKCWQSHAWIEQEGAAGTGIAVKPDKQGEGPATELSPEWPGAKGAVFALRDGNTTSPVIAFDDQGRDLMGFTLETRGRALFGRYHELVCDGGAFLAPNAGAWSGAEVARSGAFSIEVTLTPAAVPPKSPGVVLACADARGEDVALIQDKSGLVLRLPENPPIALFEPEAGKPVHVVVLCGKGKWIAYRNGRVAGSGTLSKQPPAWGSRQLIIGTDWKGADPWHGRMEGIALFPRALLPKEAAAQASAIHARYANRKPATRIRFQGTLVRQANTSRLEEIQPYTRSLSVAEYKVDKVIEGAWSEPAIHVMHWMIMAGKRLPLADRKLGDKVEIIVESLGEHPQLESSRRDEIEDADLDAKLFYCESETAP